jgi:hypothetical protein
MLRDIKGVEGALVEFTKVPDCGVNVFKLPELLGAMEEGEGEVKECLDPVSSGLGKGKRGLFNEMMNDIVEVFSLTRHGVVFETVRGEVMKKERTLGMRLG